MKKWFKKHYHFIIGFSIIIITLIFDNFLDNHFDLKSNHMLRLAVYILVGIIELIVIWILFKKVGKYLENE